METTKQLEECISELRKEFTIGGDPLTSHRLAFAKMVQSTIKNEPGLAQDEIKTLLKAVDLIRLFY